MASIEKRDGKYRVQIRKKGFPQISRLFETEEEGINFARESEEAIEKSKYIGESPRLPLKIWLDRFEKEHMADRKEAKRDKIKINFWREKLGNEIAKDLSSEYIAGTAQDLVRTKTKVGIPLSEETIRKYIVMLSIVYKTAIEEWKWASHNPCCCHVKKKSSHRKKSEDPWEDNPFRQELTIQMNEMKQKLGIKKTKVKSIFGISPSTLQCAINLEGNPSIKNLMNILKHLGLTLEIKQIKE